MKSSTHLSVRVHLQLDRFPLDAAFSSAHRVTGIFGVSGSGKTSLLETIAGIRRGAEGRISFGDGIWLDSAKKQMRPPEERGIGYVPQDSLLFPHRTVQGNLEAGRRRAENTGKDFDSIFRSVIRVLELETLLDRNVSALSGGERQRVSLGRALCSGPQLLLLDEPLASLDAALRRKVLPFLRRVQQEFTVPILLVSHNPVEILALCDHLVVLKEGQVIAEGDPRETLTRPEVFPIAENEGFENILPGTVEHHTDHTTIVRIANSEHPPHLIVPHTDEPPGSGLLLGIPAHEIILARERPSRISARNVLPGIVQSVSSAGNARLVTVTIASTTHPIVAELTGDAVLDLDIRQGTEVFLVLKTSSITLYREHTGMAP